MRRRVARQCQPMRRDTGAFARQCLPMRRDTSALVDIVYERADWLHHLTLVLYIKQDRPQ